MRMPRIEMSTPTLFKEQQPKLLVYKKKKTTKTFPHTCIYNFGYITRIYLIKEYTVVHTKIFKLFHNLTRTIFFIINGREQSN